MNATDFLRSARFLHGPATGLRRKFLQRLVGAVAMLGCAMASAGEPRLELRNERLTLATGQAERGAIVSMCRNNGEEFVAPATAPILFALTFSKQATPPGERFTLTSRDAKQFHAEQQAHRVTLTYDGLANWPVRVTCTANMPVNDPLVRWRITVQTPEGLVLEAVRFPIVTLRTPLGAGDDDAVVLGSTKGGVIRRPGAMKVGCVLPAGVKNL